MQRAIDAVDDAAQAFVPGQLPGSMIELPKLALADATLAAIEAQRALAEIPRPRAVKAAHHQHRRRRSA